MEDRNMSTPQSFEDLEAWRAARQLTNEAYRLCRRESLSRDFGLCDQFRRAAVSVMNDIAEGWELYMSLRKNSSITARVGHAANYAQ